MSIDTTSTESGIEADNQPATPETPVSPDTTMTVGELLEIIPEREKSSNGTHLQNNLVTALQSVSVDEEFSTYTELAEIADCSATYVSSALIRMLGPDAVPISSSNHVTLKIEKSFSDLNLRQQRTIVMKVGAPFLKQTDIADRLNRSDGNISTTLGDYEVNIVNPLRRGTVDSCIAEIRKAQATRDNPSKPRSDIEDPKTVEDLSLRQHEIIAWSLVRPHMKQCEIADITGASQPHVSQTLNGHYKHIVHQIRQALVGEELLGGFMDTSRLS